MEKFTVGGTQIANTHVSKLHWRIPLPFPLNYACVSSFLTSVITYLAGRMEGEKKLFGFTLSKDLVHHRRKNTVLGEATPVSWGANGIRSWETENRDEKQR